MLGLCLHSPVKANSQTSKNRQTSVIHFTAQESISQLEQLYQQGKDQYHNSEYQDALATFQQILQILQSSNQLAPQGKILNYIGAIHYNLGQYSAALNYYQQALLISRKTGDQQAEGQNLNNIGALHENQGNYAQALQLYQQALAIFTELGSNQDIAGNLNNVALVHSHLGQYQKALENQQKALSIYLKINDKIATGLTLHNIGFTYESLGQYDQAVELYQQSLTVRRETNDKLGEVKTLNNLGFIHTYLEEDKQALVYLEEALLIAKEINDLPSAGDILDSIGKAYQQLGNQAQALSSYQQSLIIQTEISNRTDQRITLNNLGDLFTQQEQPELAIIFYKQSVNITESIRHELRSLPFAQQNSYTNTIADTYRRLADLLLQQNRVLEAQQVLELLKVQELDDYLGNVRGDNQGVEFLPQEQHIQDNLTTIVNREIDLGKELTQLEQIPITNRTPTQQERILQLRTIQQQVREQFNQFIRSEEVTLLLEQLSYKARRQSLDLEYLNSFRDDLQRLEQNVVLLTPLILEDRLELVLTTPYSPPIHRPVAVTKEQLHQAIVDFRLALADPTSDAKTIAQKLYNWLIKPIEADLAQAEAQTIIYAPDGQLRYLPLAALYDGKQWLVERFGINNITAATLTELNTPPSAETKVMAGAATGRYNVSLGNYRYSFARLPFAKVEVENLTATIPQTTQLLDREFNRIAVLPYLNDHTIIHLATHAMFVTGKPEDSFILLGDGDTITLREMDTLSLTNVDLVVLSACDTGIGGRLGNGEEILGFGYQIQKTGARAAIASLWKVNDGGTQVLMNTFYKALQSQKTTKTEALKQAQMYLITGDNSLLNNFGATDEVTKRLNHPHYWAPFILIGNGL